MADAPMAAASLAFIPVGAAFMDAAPASAELHTFLFDTVQRDGSCQN
jgi:hypothetical protein